MTGVQTCALPISEDTEYLVDHTSLIYVIGPDGKYAAHFSHGTPVEDIVARLKRLV